MYELKLCFIIFLSMQVCGQLEFMKSMKIEAPGILMIHSNLLVVFKYSVFIMTDEGDSVLMVDNKCFDG